jgi:hypothetical protein
MGYMPGGFGCAAAGPGVVDEKTGRRVGVRLEYVDPRDGARPGQLGRYITKLQAGFELTHQLDASRAAVQGLCAVRACTELSQFGSGVSGVGCRV